MLPATKPHPNESFLQLLIPLPLFFGAAQGLPHQDWSLQFSPSYSSWSSTMNTTNRSTHYHESSSWYEMKKCKENLKRNVKILIPHLQEEFPELSSHLLDRVSVSLVYGHPWSNTTPLLREDSQVQLHHPPRPQHPSSTSPRMGFPAFAFTLAFHDSFRNLSTFEPVVVVGASPDSDISIPRMRGFPQSPL